MFAQVQKQSRPTKLVTSDTPISINTTNHQPFTFPKNKHNIDIITAILVYDDIAYHFVTEHFSKSTVFSKKRKVISTGRWMHGA